MKKKLRDELMESVEQVYVELIPVLFPKLTIRDEERTAFLQTWRRSPFKKGMDEFLRRFPDEQFQLFHNLLKRFPLELRKYLQTLQQSAHSFGGRTPLLTDSLRREACEKFNNFRIPGLNSRGLLTMSPRCTG
jgi:hypothetical protein